MTTYDPTDAAAATSDPAPERRSLRLSCEADVLAFVPYSLGFLPHDSVVMVAIGPRGTPMVARADLADDPHDRRGAAQEVSRAAVLNRIDHVLLVAYTDDPGRALTAVDDLGEALGEHGIPVAHAFRADGERWFTLLPEDATWSTGTAYDVTVHQLTAESVLEGRVTHADRAALEATLDPADPDLVDAVEDAIALLEDDDPLAPPASPRHDRRQLRREAEWASAWVRDRTGHPLEVHRLPPAADVARVLRVLQHDEARDVVLAEVTRETADAQVELWRSVARLAPPGHRAPASAMLAFAAWLHGNGALAWCAVDRAREADPDHALAGLVADALESAMPPTAWRGVDRGELRLLSA